MGDKRTIEVEHNWSADTWDWPLAHDGIKHVSAFLCLLPSIPCIN